MRKYKYNYMKLILRKADASDFTAGESEKLQFSFIAWAGEQGLVATGVEYERFDDDRGAN